MTGDAMREVFEAVLPTDLIEAFACFFGVVERERLFEVATFVRASVIAAGSPGGGLQADTIRNTSRPRASRWRGPRSIGSSTSGTKH